MPVDAHAIYDLADDALQNLFDVLFSESNNVTGFASDSGVDLAKMTLRVTEFTKPEKGFDAYEVNYKTLKIVKPTAKTTFANEFSFTIRLDRAYSWYKFFEKWNHAILNTDSGDIASDSADSNLRANVQVTPQDQRGWVFYQAFPKTVPSISYTADSGEPVTCEITFACNRMSTLS